MWTNDNTLVRQIDLSDWDQVKLLQQEVKGSKAERFIYVDDRELENIFFNSKIFDKSSALLGLLEGEALLGMVALMVQGQSQLHIAGAPLVYNCFIQSVYISPRASSDAGYFFDYCMMKWAVSRGCHCIFGNVSHREGRVNAFVKKYGFEPYHTVIGKRLITDGQE